MNFKTQQTFSCKSRSKQKGECRYMQYKTYHKNETMELQFQLILF